MSAPLPHDTWIEAVTPGSCIRQLPEILARALVTALPTQRWFGEKGREIAAVTVARIATLPLDDTVLALVVADIAFASGPGARYFTPVVVAPANDAARSFAEVDVVDGSRWSIIDAPTDSRFQRWLIEAAGAATVTPGIDATFSWSTDAAGSAALASAGSSSSRLLTGEQSNSNIAYGDAALIKVFRRVQAGINPDVELGRYLSGPAGSTHVPRLLAAWEVTIGDDVPASIGIAQQLVANVGDGWTWTGSQLVAVGADPVAQSALVEAIRLLGHRTGGIHAALAAATDPGLEPEPIGPADIADAMRRVRAAADALVSDLGALDRDQLDPRTRDLALAFLAGVDTVVADLDGFALGAELLKTRVHGDYHLGQTLRTIDGDWTLIDFEGEPARSLTERQARMSPLKDVAGMVRSLGYARAFASRVAGAWTDPERRLEEAFLEGYRRAVLASPMAARIAPTADDAFAAALRPWIVEKALYEIAYEMNNRPDWLWAPLAALQR